MACKYFAPNGKPSKLFDSLFSYFKDEEKMPPYRAEMAAVTSWLAVRGKEFIGFAGNWTQDTTDPVSVIRDENGEPLMMYMGKSDRFKDLPWTNGWDFTASKQDYNFTSFVSLKKPLMVEVTGDISKANIEGIRKDFQADNYDGIVFTTTAENGTIEKHYVVKDVEQIQPVMGYKDGEQRINTTFDKWVDKNFLQETQAATVAKEPVTDFMLENDNSFRLLQTIIKGSDSAVSKIARGILVKAERSIPVKTVTGSDIQFKEKAIEVGESLNISRERFNKLLLAEILQAYQTMGDSSATFTNMWNYFVMTKRDALPREVLNSKEGFINSFFKDRKFYSWTKDTLFPGGQISIRDLLISDMAKTFDLRDSYKTFLTDLIESAQIIRTSGISFYSSSGEETEVPTEEEPEPIKKPKKEIKLTAPFAHLLTNDPVLDKHIAATFEKLQSLRSRIKKKGKEKDNTRIRADITKYEKELNDLVQQQSVAALISVGQREVMRMKNSLQRTQSHDEVWENLNLIESWIDFSSDFDKSEADPNVLYAVRQISINAIELYNDYKQLYWDSVTAAMSNEGVPVNYLEQISPDQVIEDIGSAAASFIGLSFGEHGLEVAADMIIRQAAANINSGMIDFQQRLKDHLDKLGSKDISFMFKLGEDGRYRPITSYKSQLYTMTSKLRHQIQDFEKERRPMYDKLKALNAEYREAVRSKDKLAMARTDQQIRELREEINAHKEATKSYGSMNDFMRDNFDYTLTDEGKAEFAEFAEILKEGYYDYNPDTGEMEFSELRYRYDLEQHNPEKLVEWLADPKSTYPRFAAKYFAIKPKAKWANDEFGSFTTTQQEFYDFFVKEYLAAQANVPMDYSFTDYDADRLLMEFAYMDEATLNKFQMLGKEVKDFIKDIATVKYFEPDISYDQTSPFSKRQVKKLKFKPVSDFTKGTDGYWKEGETLPESLQKGLDEKRYKYKDGYLVISSTGPQNEKLVNKIVTKEDDPLKIFNNFIKFGLAYKYKKEVENTLNGIQELAYATPKEEEKNKGVTNPLGLRFGQKNGSNLEKRLGYTIDAFLTGNLKDRLPFTSKGKPGDRVWSGGQLIDSLNNLTRARQLGLNPISGISNLSMGTASNFMYAARDEFFNEAELRKAYGIIKDSIATFYTGGGAVLGNSRKIALLLQQFNMLGNLQEQFYMDNPAIEKVFEHLYIFQKGGEYLNQGATTIAMMLREKIKVGKEEVSLWDAFEEKDGKLIFKYPDSAYADPKKQFVFAEAAKKVNKEIHGDYDILNPIGVKRQVWGRVGMLFRTWMPQAIKQRLGGRHKDYQLSELKGKPVYREGRWNTAARAFNFIQQVGTVRADKGLNILKFVGSIAATTISNKAGRKLVDTMHIDESDRANMYANVKEAWFATIISVATALLLRSFSSDDDDKDPIKESWLKYLYNQTSRVESELWFFYDPISFSKIVRDAIPMWSTFKQAIRVGDAAKTLIFDSESDVYQRGFRKGDSKFATQLQLFFPISKQLQSIWSMASQLYSDKYY